MPLPLDDTDDDAPRRTIAGAILANRPCERHCAICDGDDHHWLAECDSDGAPIMVCKHCEAWREMTDDEDAELFSP